MVAFASLWLYICVQTLQAKWVPPVMKKVVLTLFAILEGTSFAMAADGGCDAFKWPVAREQALFPAAPTAQSGATLAAGEAADLALEPVDAVSFTVPPERAPAAGTFGATASVTARRRAADHPVRRGLGRRRSGRPCHEVVGF